MTDMSKMEHVMEVGNLRLPTTLATYGIGIEGWHEGNALFTPVWDSLNDIKANGVEEYVKTYIHDSQKTFSFFHKMARTKDRAGGIEYAYEHFLYPHMKRGQSLLDVGCGQGELGIWCATAGVDYTGIDVALVNVGFAEAMKPCLKFMKPDSPMPVYQQGVMEDLRLDPDRFDIVFSSHSLEHVHDIDKTFEQMCHYGTEICAVVAKPKADEAGEHMRQITTVELRERLESCCSKWSLMPLSMENVFWGKVK